jgi:hypothetical protein
MAQQFPAAPARLRSSFARRVDLLLWRFFGQGARVAAPVRQQRWLAGLAALWLALTR